MREGSMNGRTLLDNLLECNDQELLTMLPYIRDENGERVSIVELKHYLREEYQRRIKANCEALSAERT